MLKRIITPVLFLLVFISNSFGEELKPVKWKFESKFNGGNEYDMMIRAKIDPKWHIFSTNMVLKPNEVGPIITKIIIDKSTDYELVGNLKEQAKLINHFDKNFDLTLSYIETEATYIQRIKLKTLNAKSVKGTVEFMTCDDSKCLAPETIHFEIKLNKKFNVR